MTIGLAQPQPLPVHLVPGVPQQIPTLGNGKGVQIINQTTESLSLCADQNFADPIIIKTGVSMPWTTTTTVYALSVIGGTIFVLPDPTSYYDPNVLPQNATAQLIETQVISSANFNVISPLTVPEGTSVLVIVVTMPNGITSAANLAVWGINTGTPYCGVVNAPSYTNGRGVYLFSNGSSFSGTSKNAVWYVPISSSADPEVGIAFNYAAGGLGSTINVYADPNNYKESQFYNGTIQHTQLGSGGGTLASGPVRLLTASVTCSTAGAGGNISIGADVILNESDLTSVGTAGRPLTFPPNTLVPYGVNVTAGGAGLSFAGLTYAYP